MTDLNTFDFSWDLSTAWKYSDMGPMTYRNPAKAEAHLDRVRTAIADSTHEARMEYARILKSRVWKNTSDYGDLRMWNHTNGAYRLFIRLAGIDDKDV